MNNADGQIIIQVTLDDKKAEQGLKDIDNGIDKVEKNGTSKFKLLGNGIKNFAKVAVIGAGAVAGIGAAIIGLAAPLVQAAGAAQALNSQFSQVFGDLEKQATASLNKIAEETSILPERLKGSFVQMAAFAKTTGMDTAQALALTERATLAAADSAAFYDRNISEVTENLQSFLKGNYENDAALGISATEFTRNAAAMELYGKKFIELSESQKQLTLLKMVEDGNKLSGALGQAAREGEGLENVVGNLKQAWENLKVKLGEPILDYAVTALVWLTNMLENFNVAPFIAAFERIASHVKAVFEFLQPYIQQGLAFIRGFFEENGNTITSKVQEFLGRIRAFWDENGASIMQRVKETFSTILSIIESVLAVVIPFVQAQLEKVRQFWDENGEQIIQAVKNAFETIKAIIDFVMPAIQLLIETVWGAIQDIISGTLDVVMGLVQTFSAIFTGDWEGLWEGIKTLLSGAVDLVMGILTLSFFGGIRKVFTNLLSTGVKLIKDLKDDVVLKFQDLKDEAIKKVLSMKDDFIKKIVELKDEAIKKAVELKDSFIKKIKEIDLYQIGKDVVQGLINGITSKLTDAWNAASEIGSTVIKGASKILQRNSPSKAFIAIGKDTGDGLIIGLKDKYREVAKAAEKLGQVMLDNISDEIQVDVGYNFNAGKELSENLKVTPSTKQLTSIINPFRNAKLDVGRAFAQSNLINNSTINNHYNGSNELAVSSSPVYLDNQIVGEIIHRVVSHAQGGEYRLSSIMNGLNIGRI